VFLLTPRCQMPIDANRGQLPDTPRIRGNILPKSDLPDTGKHEVLLNFRGLFGNINLPSCHRSSTPTNSGRVPYSSYPRRPCTIATANDTNKSQAQYRVCADENLPNVPEPSILDVVNKLDPPRPRIGGSRYRTPESKDKPSHGVAVLIRHSMVDLHKVPNKSTTVMTRFVKTVPGLHAPF